MPELTTFFTQNGIPEYALVWILMVPIAMTAAVISRQVIGIKGFGISTPLFVGFAFVATGIQAGIIIYITALAAGFVMRLLLEKVRLLYLPKLALIITGVTMAVFLLIPLLPYHKELQFPQAIFSFVILILLVEQFTSFLIERGVRKTFNIALETLAVSLVTFFLVTWAWLQDTIVSYPLFVIIAVVVVNFALGKWPGLRFSEYIRFRDLIFK